MILTINCSKNIHQVSLTWETMDGGTLVDLDLIRALPILILSLFSIPIDGVPVKCKHENLNLWKCESVKSLLRCFKPEIAKNYDLTYLLDSID